MDNSNLHIHSDGQSAYLAVLKQNYEKLKYAIENDATLERAEKLLRLKKIKDDFTKEKKNLKSNLF